MLALLGLTTVLALLVLIMSRRMSPLVALIVVPTTAALAGGFGLGTAQFILTGVQQTASVAAMFVFAILYFGIMTDAGMLDPIVDRILRAVGTRPARIVMGSALLALLVHLDGSGAVTFLVTVPAMLPLFDRLQHGQADSRLRRVAGGRRQLPAMDGSHAAGVDGAAHSDGRSLQAADSSAAGWSDVRIRRRLPTRQARGTAAGTRRRPAAHRRPRAS